MKILVISDNKDFISGFRILLSKEPYEISEASDGKKGLIIAGKQLPDLVLIDVVLSGMDGYEVCRQLKTNPDLDGIFVVLVSGIKTTNDDLAGRFEGGADGYITKPVVDRELFDRIKAYTRIIRSEKALRESEEMLRYIFEIHPWESLSPELTDP